MGEEEKTNYPDMLTATYRRQLTSDGRATQGMPAEPLSLSPQACRSRAAGLSAYRLYRAALGRSVTLPDCLGQPTTVHVVGVGFQLLTKKKKSARKKNTVWTQVLTAASWVRR